MTFFTPQSAAFRHYWRRTARAAAGGLMALVAPVSAQAQTAMEIAAPCLAQLASQDAYVEALEAEGWTRLTKKNDRDAALMAVSQPAMAAVFLPSPVETLAEFMAFSEDVANYGASRFERAEFLSRGPVALVVEFASFIPGRGDLTCIFASNALPAASEILDGDGIQLEGSMMIVGQRDIALPADSITLRLDALRLDVPPMFWAGMTGREAIFVRHSFRVSE